MSNTDTVGRVFGHLPVQGIGEQISKVMLAKKFQPIHSMVLEDCFVGIEIEVEQILSSDNIMYFSDIDKALWKNIEDGSLRNEGREYVSVPLQGKHVPFALSALHKKLTTTRSLMGHEFTERTSVHVHINALDLTCEQVANFILIYSIVEPLMYAFAGGNRHNNIFCVPLNMSTTHKQLNRFFNLIEQDDGGTAIADFHHWHKYTGFNLKPLTQYGTIEFRHMVGNCNVEHLTNWINLIMRIHKFASRSNYLELKERILNLNSSSEYDFMLTEIFGQDRDLLITNNIQKFMEDMVIFLKDVYSYREDTKFFIPYSNQKDFINSPEKYKFMDRVLRYGFFIKREIEVDKKIKELKEQIGKYTEVIARKRTEAVEYNRRRLLELPGSDQRIALVHSRDHARLQVANYKKTLDGLVAQLKELESF